MSAETMRAAASGVTDLERGREEVRGELRALLARHAAAGTPAPVVIRRIQDVIEQA